MRKILALFICLTLPAFAGGALDFDGLSYYTCPSGWEMETDSGAPGWKQVGVMAWVTPDFASTDTSKLGIIGNRDISVCPREGLQLSWEGSGTAPFRGFVLSADYSNCCGFSCPGTPPAAVFVYSQAVFSAGDLLGIAGVVKNGVQQLTTYNATTGLYYNGSEFRGWHASAISLDSDTALEIGRSGPNNNASPWIGKIHLLVLQVGEAKNSNNKQLDAISKFRFSPQYTGTTGLNGSSGTQILDGVWLFEDDDGAGGVPLTLRNDAFNASGNGVDVCNVVGTPVPVETEMMR